jgi:hypothetical protein
VNRPSHAPHDQRGLRQFPPQPARPGSDFRRRLRPRPARGVRRRAGPDRRTHAATPAPIRVQQRGFGVRIPPTSRSFNAYGRRFTVLPAHGGPRRAHHLPECAHRGFPPRKVCPQWSKFVHMRRRHRQPVAHGHGPAGGYVDAKDRPPGRGRPSGPNPRRRHSPARGDRNRSVAPGTGASDPVQRPALCRAIGHQPQDGGPRRRHPDPSHHRRAPWRASRSGSRRHLPTPRVTDFYRSDVTNRSTPVMQPPAGGCRRHRYGLPILRCGSNPCIR